MPDHLPAIPDAIGALADRVASLPDPSNATDDDLHVAYAVGIGLGRVTADVREWVAAVIVARTDRGTPARSELMGELIAEHGGNKRTLQRWVADLERPSPADDAKRDDAHGTGRQVSSTNLDNPTPSEDPMPNDPDPDPTPPPLTMGTIRDALIAMPDDKYRALLADVRAQRRPAPDLLEHPCQKYTAHATGAFCATCKRPKTEH